MVRINNQFPVAPIDKSRIGIRSYGMLELHTPTQQTVNGKCGYMTLDGKSVYVSEFRSGCDHAQVGDLFIDFLPGVSTISNIGILIFKCLICPFLKQETIQKCGVCTYWQNKSVTRCFLSLIPIINMLVTGFLFFARVAEDKFYTSIEESGLALQFTSHKFRSNPKMVFTAVKQNGLALEFASDQLKNDPKIVLAAVKQNGMALQFADVDDQVLNQVLDQKIPEKGIQELIKSYTRFRPKSDKKTVLAAVKQNGLAIQFATVKLRNDLEIALAAVRQDPRALQYISKALQNNEEILAAAMPQSRLAG